jgi:hypothetical protein
MIFKKFQEFNMKNTEYFIDKTSDFLNHRFFSHSEIYRNRAVKFVAVTSQITHFFLFNPFGSLLYTAFVAYVFFTNGKNFNLIYYATQAQGWSSFLSNCFHYLDWSFFFLLSFLSILFELVFLNTVLVSIPEIKKKILEIYGDNFLRERGYNSRFGSMVRLSERTFVLAVAASAAFLGSAAGQLYESETYRQSYQKYLEVKIANPSIDCQPPERGVGFNINFPGSNK